MCELVQVCSCCNSKFSQIDVALINAKHREELYFELTKLLINLQLKGKASLAIADEVIFGINYGYADANEVEKAEFICEQIADICSKFLDEVLSESECEFYPLAA
jgi:hypothetical protein